MGRMDDRYVFTPDYVGRDRRQETRRRIFERRRVDAGALAPSVETALRMLCMRVMELEHVETAAAFFERLEATRALAETRSQTRVAEALRRLIEALRRNDVPAGGKSDFAATLLKQASSEMTP